MKKMNDNAFKYRIDESDTAHYHLTISEYDKLYASFFDYFKVVKLPDVLKYSIPVKTYFKRLKYLFIMPGINKIDEERPISLYTETMIVYKYRFKSYDLMFNLTESPLEDNPYLVGTHTPATIYDDKLMNDVIPDTWKDFKLLLEMISV